MESLKPVAISARLLAVGSALPSRVITTEELVQQAFPGRDPTKMLERTGIATRRWVTPGTTAAELGAEALRDACARGAIEPSDLRRVIFVNTMGGDAIVPATANEVCARLGLGRTCDAFDLSNTCVGFLSALDVAARGVATGVGPTAVVVSEVFSRHLKASDPRPFMILADGAAAIILDRGTPQEGVIEAELRNDGTRGGQVVMAHGGLTGRDERLTFAASYDEMMELAIEYASGTARSVLRKSGLALADVDWVLPHQPNGNMLNRMLDALDVPRERTMPIARELGSLGAASIPLSLDRIVRDGRLQRPSTLLLISVGAGLAYGSTLIATRGLAR